MYFVNKINREKQPKTTTNQFVTQCRRQLFVCLQNPTPQRLHDATTICHSSPTHSLNIILQQMPSTRNVEIRPPI